MTGSAPILEMKDISKTFPGVKALTNVSLTVYPGEIHALMGENGAGKSTLMKILSGAYQADPGGEIRINGQHVTIDGPLTARHHGISIIYQELSLAPNLSVAENMLLGREHKSGPMVDRRSMEKASQAVLERLGVHFKATTKVSELSMAERQLVEIARALIANSRILVMDEPTTSLSSRETEALFTLIRQLRAEGLAIIYISHRMAEIYELAERVSVLRDGSYVGTLVGDEISAERLVQMMVGRDLSSFYKKEHDAHQSRGHVMFAVRNMGDGVRVHDCSFELHEGEVLGIAGLVGAGRTELARLIYGADSRDERRGVPPGQATVDPSAGGCDQFRRRLPDGRPQASRPLPRSHGPRERERQRALAGCAHGRRPQPEVRQAQSRGSDPGARHPRRGGRGARRQPVRRQSAEGPALAPARDEAQGAHPRRADPRRRYRRQVRNLPPDRRASPATASA